MTKLDTDTKPPVEPAIEERATILRLVFRAGDPCLPPQIWRIPRGGLSIGREVEPGLRVNDDSRLSRHHATVFPEEAGTLGIVDKQSKNGTWINGQREQQAKLRLGDVVSVGDSSLVVAHEPTSNTPSATPSLIGDSAAMRAVRALIEKLGPARTTVLLTGETGCGKEVAARAIHAASGLTGEFVAVNCAAVPDSLFEAQFFGHRAGAFTGAAAHDGFFRAAHGGTLFLDEVGELPLPQQAKLLRAIQERAVVPLGTVRPLPCNVRIVAATNRNLAQAVELGTFRADLLARLFESQVMLPAVRDRREDILELFGRGFDGERPPMSHALAEALLLHHWPYNVRELLATARELATEGSNGGLDVAAFRRRVASLNTSGPSSKPTAPQAKAELPPLSVLELSRVLAKNGGSVARVAREVGRSRRQIYRWIEKHGIDIDLFRRSDEADRE